MAVHILFWLFVGTLTYTEPYAPPLPEGRPPTPAELTAHINTKTANRHRQMLLLTYLSRKQLEGDTRADYSKLIESHLRIEEDLKWRIEAIETRPPRPQPPYLPMIGADPFDPKRPKPPVRD